MAEVVYICDNCQTSMAPNRARVRCQSCPNYDLCAECHVTQSFSEPHQAHHGYEVHQYGRKVVDVNGQTVSAVRSRLPMPLPPVSHSLQPSGQGPLYRLAIAIFMHFDPTSTGVLNPNQFSALVSALGFTAAEFPPLSVALNPSAAPAQLHNCDAWLATWYGSLGLEFRLSTREFAPPPPVQPINGRIRMRDELLRAVMYPPPLVVQGGMPMLPLSGLQQYLAYQVKLHAGNLCERLTHLLGVVPELKDLETGKPVSAELVSAACAPPPPNVVVEQRMRWLTESRERAAINEALRIQKNHYIVNQNTATMLKNIVGGWKVDSYGNQVWEVGLV